MICAAEVSSFNNHITDKMKTKKAKQILFQQQKKKKRKEMKYGQMHCVCVCAYTCGSLHVCVFGLYSA